MAKATISLQNQERSYGMCQEDVRSYKTNQMTKWRYGREKCHNTVRSLMFKVFGDSFPSEYVQIFDMLDMFLAKAPTKQGKKEWVCPHCKNKDGCICWQANPLFREEPQTTRNKPKKVKEIELPELPDIFVDDVIVDTNGFTHSNMTDDKIRINMLTLWAEAVTKLLKNK